MVIAGLIFGLLSVTVFWWLGVTLGGIFAAGASVDAVISGGDVHLSTTPLWAFGLGIGVALPLVSIAVSAVAMGKGQSKGLGIAGIISGAVAALLGLGFTLFTVFALNLTDTTRTPAEKVEATRHEQKMQETLNDPAFQAQIMKAMEAAAAAQQSGSSASKDDNVGSKVPSKTPAPNAEPIALPVVSTDNAGAAQPH